MNTSNELIHSHKVIETISKKKKNRTLEYHSVSDFVHTCVKI